jgi:hypothetical protein
MWIVRLALRRPYTFVVTSMLVLIPGVVTIVRMPTDIFPQIDIPVVSVADGGDRLGVILRPPAPLPTRPADGPGAEAHARDVHHGGSDLA